MPPPDADSSRRPTLRAPVRPESTPQNRIPNHRADSRGRIDTLRALALLYGVASRSGRRPSSGGAPCVEGWRGRGPIGERPGGKLGFPTHATRPVVPSAKRSVARRGLGSRGGEHTRAGSASRLRGSHGRRGGRVGSVGRASDTDLSLDAVKCGEERRAGSGARFANRPPGTPPRGRRSRWEAVRSFSRPRLPGSAPGPLPLSPKFRMRCRCSGKRYGSTHRRCDQPVHAALQGESLPRMARLLDFEAFSCVSGAERPGWKRGSRRDHLLGERVPCAEPPVRRPGRKPCPRAG